MLEFLGDALGSIISGGATGLIGTGITLFGEYKKQKLSFEHEAKMKQLDTDANKQLAEYQLKGIQVQSEADINQLDAANFGKAIDSDKASYSNGAKGFMGVVLSVVDVIRGLVRPTVTAWFCYLAYRIYIDIQGKVAALPIEAKDTTEVLSMHQNITMVLLYLTCTAVTYWFGTRIKTQKPLTKMFGGDK